MGFRSDGTCSVCGRETANEYVCNSCQEVERAARIRKLTVYCNRYPVIYTIQCGEPVQFFTQYMNLSQVLNCLRDSKIPHFIEWNNK